MDSPPTRPEGSHAPDFSVANVSSASDDCRPHEHIDLPVSPITIRSGIVDVDRQIYVNLDGRSLLDACRVDRYAYSLCDEVFWATKMLRDFGWCLKRGNRTLYLAVYRMSPDERYVWTCEQGELDIVVKLSDGAGADTLRDGLYGAVTRGHVRVVEWFVSRGVIQIERPLIRAAVRSGHVSILESLVVGAGAADQLFVDVFYWAVEYGQVAIVDYCVASGVDLTQSEFALESAVEHGHIRLLEYLVAHGAPIRAMSGYSLYLATRAGRLDLVKYLTSFDVGVTAFLDTCISWACVEKHYAIVDHLRSLRDSRDESAPTVYENRDDSSRHD